MGARAPSDLPWRPSPCQSCLQETDSLHGGGVDGGCRLWLQYRGPMGGYSPIITQLVQISSCSIRRGHVVSLKETQFSYKSLLIFIARQVRQSHCGTP